MTKLLCSFLGATFSMELVEMWYAVASDQLIEAHANFCVHYQYLKGEFPAVLILQKIPVTMACIMLPMNLSNLLL